MKKYFTRIPFAMLAGIAFLLASCSKDEPLPLSKADFRVASIVPEVDIPVKFENLSLNASTYKWDFGDGTFDSAVVAPEHTYDEAGTYSVKLTAYTEDGQTSESVQDVNVGRRYLTSMFIISINMNDPDGNPWDPDGSGPDVLFQLGPEDAQSIDDLSFVFIDSLNVGQFKTPIGITTENLVPQDYVLANKNYFILLQDVDTVNNEPVFVDMAQLLFNPVIPEDEFITVVKREDGTGDITIPFIVINEYQFFLEFEIR